MKLITNDTQFATGSGGEFGRISGCMCGRGGVGVDLTGTGLAIDRTKVGIE